MLNVVLVPSNQLNVATGDPAGAATAGATYEQDIWLPAAQAASDEFARQGHLAIVEYVRGVGSATTDELNTMCDRGVAWLKTAQGDKRVLSFHSNVGSGTQYMYPLIGVEASRLWSHRFRDFAIKYTGFIPRAATVRSLMFFSHFNFLGTNKVVLMEIGEHQTKPSAMYLWTYREYLGRMLARAFIQACGYPLANDNPMAQGVPVPPGVQYDKYRYKAPAVADPSVVGSIAWVEKKLDQHYTGDAAVPIDGIWSPTDSALLKKFQSEHYGPDGKRLVATGLYPLDAQTLGKLKSV
jgi:hypothetical protein